MTWQDRLINEHSDVSDRLAKLREFINEPESSTTTAQFRALPEDDQDDLLEQLTHMEGYEAVLLRRIARLSAQAVPQ